MSNIAQILESIGQAHKAERLAQAYILAGSPRDGGVELAQGILKLLYCQGGCSEAQRCAPCAQVLERTHPDVLWVEPQKKSRIITIDQVRAVQTRVQQTAFVGGWKAVVLMSADRLGPAASNAILKTLEEPTARTLFLLLTDSPQQLLPTILSRCQIVHLPDVLSLENEWTASLLEILLDGHAGAGESPSVIAEFAQTHRITALFKEMQAAAETLTAEEADETTANEEKDTLAARGNALYREWRRDVMRALLVWYRDVLLLVSGASPEMIFFEAHREALTNWAATITYRQALTNVNVVDDMHAQLERNLPEGLVFAHGLGRLN